MPCRKSDRRLTLILAVFAVAVNALTVCVPRADAAEVPSARVLRFALADGDELFVVDNKPETIYVLDKGPYGLSLLSTIGLEVKTRMGKEPVGKYYNVNGKPVAVTMTPENPKITEPSHDNRFLVVGSGETSIIVRVGETEQRLKYNIVRLSPLKFEMTSEDLIPLFGFPKTIHKVLLFASYTSYYASTAVDGEYYQVDLAHNPSLYVEHWFYDEYPLHFFVFESNGNHMTLVKIQGVKLPSPDEP